MLHTTTICPTPKEITIDDIKSITDIGGNVTADRTAIAATERQWIGVCDRHVWLTKWAKAQPYNRYNIFLDTLLSDGPPDQHPSLDVRIGVKNDEWFYFLFGSDYAQSTNDITIVISVALEKFNIELS